MNVAFSPRDVASLRMKLNSLHGQIVSTTNPNTMGPLLRRYIEMTDKLYLTMKAGMSTTAATISQSGQLAAPFVPGGAVISAAITGSSQLKSSAGG